MRSTAACLLLAAAGVAVAHGGRSAPASVLALHPEPWQSARSFVPGHTRVMGEETQKAEYPEDGEGPQYLAQVQPFWMGTYAVTNARFAAFVAATGHVTSAEEDGASFLVRHAMDPATEAALPKDAAVMNSQWWVVSDSARWWAPEGAGSTVLDDPSVMPLEEEEAAASVQGRLTPALAAALALRVTPQGVARIGRAQHPVVHVSGKDAAAFCAWDGGWLPTEEQWEGAARGPKQSRLYPWGNAWTPAATYRANVWQGGFPGTSTGADGWKFTSPVNSHGPQNAWGVTGMVGNTWEWTSSPWCNTTAIRLRGVADQGCYYQLRDKLLEGSLGEETVIPGPWVKKGCSFMCEQNLDYRFRPAARRMADNGTSMYTLGFRCAYDGPREGQEVEAGQVGTNTPPPAPTPLPVAKPRPKPTAAPVVEPGAWDDIVEDVEPEDGFMAMPGAPQVHIEQRPPVNEADAYTYRAEGEDTEWRDEALHDQAAFDAAYYEDEFGPEQAGVQPPPPLQLNLEELDQAVNEAAARQNAEMDVAEGLAPQEEEL